MRQYSGTDKRDPDAIQKIDYFLRDVAAAIGLLGQGKAPSGGGAQGIPGTSPDLTGYFFLPGRGGGQVGYGATGASEDLTLASTTHATKGQIYFGVGTSVPAVGATLVPSGDGYQTNPWTDLPGARWVPYYYGAGPNPPYTVDWYPMPGVGDINNEPARYPAIVSAEGTYVLAFHNGYGNPQSCVVSGLVDSAAVSWDISFTMRRFLATQFPIGSKITFVLVDENLDSFSSADYDISGSNISDTMETYSTTIDTSGTGTPVTGPLHVANSIELYGVVNGVDHYFFLDQVTATPHFIAASLPMVYDETLGFLGLGLATPGAKLDIQGYSGATTDLTRWRNYAGAQATIDQNCRFVGASTLSDLILNVASGATDFLTVYNTTTSQKILNVTEGPTTRFDALLQLGRSDTGVYWQMRGGVAPQFETSGATRDAAGTTLLVLAARTGQWTDSIACEEFRIGASHAGVRVGTWLGNGGATLDRLGISSNYTLFTRTNTTLLPAAVGLEMVRIYNDTTDGNNAAIPLRVESARTAQSGNLTDWISAKTPGYTAAVDAQCRFVGDGSLLTSVVAESFGSSMYGAPDGTIEFHLLSGATIASVVDDNTAISMAIGVVGTITGVNLDLPGAGGVVLTGGATQNVVQKTFTGNNTISAAATNFINCNTTGPRFRNGTSTTQYMRLDLSLLTAARDKKFQDVSGTVVENVAALALTGQTATITTANLLASAPAGFYRASVYVVATASTIGTLTVTLGWTDAQQAQTSQVITTPALAVGGFATAVLPMKTSGTNNITYATVVGGTSLTYNLDIRLERIA